MASISKQPNGRKTIQFIHPVDKKRKSIRLGKVSMKQAEGFKTHFEKLVAAKISGHPPDDATATWASKLSAELQKSLANHGLMKATESVTLEPFVGDWIERRSDVKPASKKVYGRAQKWLVELQTSTVVLTDPSALHCMTVCPSQYTAVGTQSLS